MIRLCLGEMIVSNRKDDRFGDGGGGGRGRGGGGGGVVRTGVNRTMGGGSVVMTDEEDVEDFDDEEGETKLMQNYKDLISDEENSDDYEDDVEEDDVVLDKEHSLSGLPRVSMEGNESYLSETRFDQCPVSPLSLKAI